MTRYPRVLWAGDAALTVEFGEVIDPQINDRVLAFARRVERRRMAGVVDVVPTYRSATVYFDPLTCDATGLAGRLETMARRRIPAGVRAGKQVNIPVLYGGAFGPDLPDMARRTGLSQRAIVELHRSVEYRVYMLGFSPGFPYLGAVPGSIAFPRLAEPRARVPAGSVGIAGSQTGIYPQESPGGWRLIGRTPLRLYDANRTRPFLLGPGDRVRFIPIARAEYERLAGRST